MNWIIAGVVFMVWGIVDVVRERKRKTAHRCNACGTTWVHAGSCGGHFPSAMAFALAHTCPKCGQEEFAIAKVPPKTGKGAVAGGVSRPSTAAPPVAQPPQAPKADAPETPAVVPVIPAAAAALPKDKA